MGGARFGFPARKLRLIGITGTNGKTTTANMLASILEADGKIVGLSSTALFRIAGKTTLNKTNMTVTNSFALQKLLRQMVDAGCEWGIIEVTSHALAQNRVAGLNFEAVAITNLTQDHLDYYHTRTMERYAKTKAKLFSHNPYLAVLNADDGYYSFFNKYAAQNTISYGVITGNVRATETKLMPDSSLFQLQLPDGSKTAVTIHLPGEFNVYNALAAASIAHGLGTSQVAIKAGLGALQSVPGRMQVVAVGKRRVIVDYAHTTDALEKLLTALRATTDGKILLVMGATGDRDKSKRAAMGKAAASIADMVYVTDDDPYTEDPASIRLAVIAGIQAAGLSNYQEIDDRLAAIKQAVSDMDENDVVALTGIGHQSYRVIGKQKVAWNEAEIAKKVLGG